MRRAGSLDALRAGDVVADRFEVDRHAGGGGMGVVYRAIDRLTGEPVALKTMAGRGDASSARFLREAAILSELRHPAIVRHVAHGATPAGERYLAMEWLEGEDLAERLGARGITPDETLLLLRQLADALAVAHARGVVHRDLKPSNVFLVEGDVQRAKLIDFGVARVGFATRAMTRTGAILGTPGYMAPEQARGDRAIDPRTDVFALGCIGYECLTGQPAFVAEHVVALLGKIVFDDPPRVRELRPNSSTAVDELIAQMLAKDPNERPRDASEIVARLEAIGGAVGGGALRPSARAPALGRLEQRLVGVVALRGQDAEPHSDPLARTIDTAQLAEIEPLRAIARAQGARHEMLADGTHVFVVSGAGTATDLAGRAARCALAVRRARGDASMALATGRADLWARLPAGDVIGRAAGLLAAPGAARAVALDDVTAALLDGRFDVVPAEIGGGVLLEGERAGADPARALLGRPTPFVGRERELAMLRAMADECVAEPVARVVLVSGAAGLGKSRLRHELLKAIDGTFEVWLARGDSVAGGSAFGMLAQIVRGTAGIRDDEPIEARREKLVARVARSVPAADAPRVARFLGEMIGARFDDADVALAAARRDARLLGDQIARAWEDFVAAELARGPRAIVLEDLHWGDAPSARLVDAALRLSHDAPLLVVAFARSEIHEQMPGLWRERGVQEIRLVALRKRASEQLVREALGGEVSDEAALAIVERAAGNPFFLEELVRGHAEGRADPPETVLATVQARLERLDAESRRVLRAAAVFGQSFWRGGVDALLGSARRTAQVEEALSVLADREIVVRQPTSRFADDEQLAFRHPLVREAAYAMLTDADRALGHRLAAEWLAQAGEQDPLVLAHHLERGGDLPRAAERYLRAAEEALAGDDLAAAATRACRGISCGAGDDVRCRLWLVQAEARRWQGLRAEAQACAEEAARAATPAAEAWLRAMAEDVAASVELGQCDRARQRVDEIGQAWPAAPSAAHLVAASHVARAMAVAGRYDAFAELLERIERAIDSPAIANDPLLVAEVSRARAWWALWCADDLGEYVARSASLVESWDAIGHARQACHARGDLGYGYLRLGLYADSERMLRGARDAADRLGLASVAARAEHNLGLALLRQGRLDEALAIELRALDALRALGDRRLEGAARKYAAKILAARGDLRGAEEQARRALACAPELGPLRAEVLATLARIELARGDAARALATAQESLALLDALGSLEEEEESLRLVHAEALAAIGDAAGARRAITLAKEALLARAARIANARWREPFLSAVPDNARTLALARELA